MKNQTLKYSSYIYETQKKIGKEVIIYSGKIITYDEISCIEDRQDLTTHLKQLVYSLKNK